MKWPQKRMTHDPKALSTLTSRKPELKIAIIYTCRSPSWKNGNFRWYCGSATVWKMVRPFSKKLFKRGREKKMNPSWGFFKEFEGKSLWFYCVECYAKEPRLDLKLKKQPAGILKYDKSNTALFKNHCKKKHPSEQINFSKNYLTFQRFPTSQA